MRHALIAPQPRHNCAALTPHHNLHRARRRSGLKGDFNFQSCGSFCSAEASENHCKYCKCHDCDFCKAHYKAERAAAGISSTKAWFGKAGKTGGTKGTGSKMMGMGMMKKKPSSGLAAAPVEAPAAASTSVAGLPAAPKKKKKKPQEGSAAAPAAG